MRRRDFLEAARGALGLMAVGGPAFAVACQQADDPLAPIDLEIPGRNRLPVPGAVPMDGLSLRAAPGAVSASGVDGWLFNGGLPGPTLRARTGERVRLSMVNGLPEETIVHWHGLDVPMAADGHPRLAVAPGESYQYDFVVRNRAGAYWYHPHPHGRTGPQVYRGLAGFLLVSDAAEEAVGLPSGGKELPLLVQDRRLGVDGTPVFEPRGIDLMAGYLGDAPYVNGVPFPYTPVERAPYRLRILNGSNARIFDLAMSDGQSFVLVGTDGGLLDRAEEVEGLFLGPGERADVLVDFSANTAGSSVLLQSRAFQVPGGMGMGMMGSGDQGRAMDLMEFVVLDTPPSSAPTPGGFPALPPIPSVGANPTRTYSFASMMGSHRINGRTFEMDRVDVTIARGAPERWRFTNPAMMPHPVHMHAGHFRVLSRTGGRGRILPWERGLKDTVLLLPGETVDVAVHFEEHRGLFLLHCHNLEHEDAGMMLNFEVV